MVFTEADRQLWLWPERRPSGGTRLVTHPYQSAHANPALEQRLRRIEFSLAEEAELTTLKVRERVRTAFHAEGITKRFYDDISEQRDQLALAITGLDESDRQFYASILLDRLIFIYFIQQKGFLDNDREYLSRRLDMVRELQGPNHFYEFYRDFLVPLFHQALGSSAPEYDDPQIQTLIGQVPYVNGGLFSKMPLERRHGIRVPDSAFTRVFALFDQYRWHLDERPTEEKNEINPEVLGYILEQYINQKERGAYYTADDITGWMAGLSIAGHFLDQMDDASIWATMREDPGRYLHEAMRHGEDSHWIPKDLEPVDWIGSEWEELTPDDIGLPTERLRETADRIQTCRRIRQRIETGEIASVDAAVTSNLDLTQLAVDWLGDLDSARILRKAWSALMELRVLDPTCGSGAFLLAAMKTLQDLYEVLFLAIEHHVRTSPGQPDVQLAALVEDAARHPSREYYLRKTIALHNLYGVDIMSEAVEIARLRLFLALVSTVSERENLEPLPDLDMNVRCGNILVGCVSMEELNQAHAGDMWMTRRLLAIEERVMALRQSYQQFQEAQHQNLGDGAASFKENLIAETETLRGELDHLYARTEDQTEDWDFNEWRRSHQPFHWMAEFPEAMLAGGFSAVIGNPPFISRKNVVPHLYQYSGFETDKAPDIYAPCMERAAGLLKRGGRFAMIAPISQISGLRFGVLRNTLVQKLNPCWATVYDLIPDQLFAAKVRPVITLGRANETGTELWTSNLRRWRKEYRSYLFATVRFSASGPLKEMKSVWPLVGDEAASMMLAELRRSKCQIGDFVSRYGQFRVGRKAVMNLRFMTAFLTEPPCWTKAVSSMGGKPGARIPQTKVKWMHFNTELHRNAAYLIFAGRLGHWLWTTVGDAFDITDSMLKWFPCDLDRLSPIAHQLRDLATALDAAQMNAPMVDRNRHFIGGFDLGQCRDITDEADQLIMKQLGVEEYWPAILMLDNRIVKSGNRGVKTSYHWLKKWTPTRGPWDPSMPE